MLVTLLIWFEILFLCAIYGAFFFKKTPFLWTVLAGLVILTVLAQFISLFLPLGWQAHLLVWVGAVGLLLTRRPELPKIKRPFAWLPLILLGLTLLVILENATHRPNNPDTNLYHAQAIRWIETYPVVPGLGNLHGRLAFNSAWLVVNALFSFSFLGTQSFHLLGSFIFLMAGLVFWQGWVALAAGRWTVSAALKAFFLPISISLLGAEISSPGTDLPASLLIWLVTILYVEWTETEQTYQVPLILLLTAFAITIKLSAVPLAFLALIPLSAVWLTGQKRRALALVACGVVVVLPFLARNLVLSGYLLYPFPALDWFSFDWKVPLERVQAEQQAVISWGRAAANSASAPFSTWFPVWFSEQNLKRRLLLWLTFSTPLAALAFRFSPRKLWLGWLALLAGVCFWFVSAPDYRFGYGLLAATLGLALALVFSWLLNRFSGWMKFGVPLLLVLLIGFCGLTLIRSFEAPTFSSRWLLPADYLRAATDPCYLANGEIFCAQAYGACSYFEFPCAPSPRPWVELRGPAWQDGFRSLPTNP
jgi:hypothetical protein